MDDPLWTDAYAPSIAELPQAEARDRFERAVERPMNLVIHGPPGAGKTAAARALARATHDDVDNDLVELNVADFFNRTKKEIRNDPRFEGFLSGEIPWVKQMGTSEKQELGKRYKSDWSKAEIISHVLKESASYASGSGTYKTLLLDSAESIREDFQQSLRRTIERYHRTTQFVITTQQPTKLIPPIRSRCFPVPMRAPTVDETVSVLASVADREEASYDEDGLEFVAADADGDLRSALLAAQTVHAEEGEITMETAYETLSEVGLDETVTEMLETAENGDFADARSDLDDLLSEGLDGEEILDEVLSAARRRYSGRRLAAVHELAGRVDLDLAEGTNDRIHLSHFLAELPRTLGR
jgi:replication factor C small subunit